MPATIPSALRRDEERRRALGRLFRERREELTYADLGLPTPSGPGFGANPRLSRRVVAALLGMTPEMYAHYEAGRVKRVTVERVQQINDVLQMPAARKRRAFELAGGDPHVDFARPLLRAVI